MSEKKVRGGIAITYEYLELLLGMKRNSIRSITVKEHAEFMNIIHEDEDYECVFKLHEGEHVMFKKLTSMDWNHDEL